MNWWSVFTFLIGLAVGSAFAVWRWKPFMPGEIRKGKDIPISCHEATFKPMLTLEIQSSPRGSGAAFRGERITFTVDTGSTHTLIPERIIKNLNIYTETNDDEPPRRIRFADGSSINKESFDWVAVRLRIGTELVKLPCIVPKTKKLKKETNPQQCEPLLGRVEILERYSLYLNAKCGVLQKHSVEDSALSMAEKVFRKALRKSRSN